MATRCETEVAAVGAMGAVTGVICRGSQRSLRFALRKASLYSYWLE